MASVKDTNRNLYDVIDSMLLCIPKDDDYSNCDLLKNSLNTIKKKVALLPSECQAEYWGKVVLLINSFIGVPRSQWQLQTVAIFTGRYFNDMVRVVTNEFGDEEE